MTINLDLLDPWFEGVIVWEDLDLVVVNRIWIGLSVGPIFLWHKDFFQMSRDELGILVEVAS